MSKFWEIRSYSDIGTAKELKKIFEKEFEGKNLYEISQRIEASKLKMFKKEQSEVKFWMRLTIPFALVLYLVLVLLLPLHFIIKGTWSYNWKPLTNYFNQMFR